MEVSELNQIKIGQIELKFIARGNIWVEDFFDSATKNFVQYLVSEAIYRTTVGQLEVIAYDSQLSGVFAPFSNLGSGENKIVKLLSNEDELYQYLLYLREHIQGIQNIIQGQVPSLFDLRQASGKVIESFKLVVLYVDVELLETRVKRLLQLLVKAGPAAGVTFIIVSTLEGINFPAQKREFQTVCTSNGQLIKGNQSSLLPNLTIKELLNRNNKALEQAKQGSKKIVAFSELPILKGSSNRQWSMSSTDGLTFSIGKYGLSNAEITMGDELNQRHNVLITGAVGQGKSNLLSVIIHSLCQNYSPRELNLYLLDFKEGVTLKAFAQNEQEGPYLPHAKALGLESDVSFGQSVLEFLFNEYKQRLALFKKYNQKSIKEFRIANPDIPLPRIVVVIDEFQLMFGDELDQSRMIADCLEKSVRLFRAAGIHFILASQTIGGSPALIGKMDSIFSQIPIRIAHKNSLVESQMTLGQGNCAAMYLKPKEAILNLDYGEISQNKKVFIAYAAEEVLAPLRNKWWESSKNKCKPPVVFDGGKSTTFLQDVSILKQLKSKQVSGLVLLGQEISVTKKYVKTRLRREIGHHIALLGAEDNKHYHAIGMLQAMAISLAYLSNNPLDRFVFCNTFEEKSKEYLLIEKLIEVVKGLGANVIQLAPEKFQDDIFELLEERKSAEKLSNNGEIYIFSVGMDRLKLKKETSFDPAPLMNFLDEAADFGIHFIGWWIKFSSLEKQAFGIGVKQELINSKVLLRLDERSSKNFTGPFYHWNSQENRGLFLNEVAEEKPITFIPYSSMSLKELEICQSMLS